MDRAGAGVARLHIMHNESAPSFMQTNSFAANIVCSCGSRSTSTSVCVVFVLVIHVGCR